nr:hypothetical protein [Tanacetum cinerariifolium]
MAFVVKSVLAYGVDLVLIKEFASFVLRKLKIHSLMNQLRILTMILQTLSTHHHNLKHTLVSYVETIITTDPKDSLIMENEDLSTILEKESDEFIKSSVEDLIPILSESKDTSGGDSEYVLPSCDDFSPINATEEKSVTFSNPLFNSTDDFTSSDDESLSDEDRTSIARAYDSNLDELTFLVTPLSDSNEDEYFTPGDDIELLLHHDPSTLMMSVAFILEGFTDEPPLEENDDLFDL